MMPYYRNRVDAGRRLAEELIQYRGSDAVVFAIPCGGVPVAVEVAKKLESPLDIVIVRKIPIPFNTEAGFGAVTEDGVPVLNQQLVEQLELTEEQIESYTEDVRSEIRRRMLVYRNKLQPSSVEGKTAIIIDDGLASGYTMLAAIKSIRNKGPAKVVVAVPVASSSAWDLVKSSADEIISPVFAHTGRFAVADFYSNWRDLTDEDVLMNLEGFGKDYKENFA